MLDVGMIVGILKSICLECNIRKGIYLLPIDAKVIVGVMLKRINEHMESWINREQASFFFGSSCIKHFSTLRIILARARSLNLRFICPSSI